ncbi:MAG: hypothetical protein HXX20_16120 [Chloroflexi bacterium]|nr:hypothetical protein [Chloroflexota bacterium]
MTADDTSNNDDNSTEAEATAAPTDNRSDSDSATPPPPHTQTPDFDSIKQVSPYGVEYWSARDLSKLLGYTDWRNFEVAIKRSITSCEQVGQQPADHFVGSNKMIGLGKSAQREIKDYILSRFGSYLISQNGDPRKPEIAAAQAYSDDDANH